jgi:hypothetical protein
MSTGHRTLASGDKGEELILERGGGGDKVSGKRKKEKGRRLKDEG